MPGFLEVFGKSCFFDSDEWFLFGLYKVDIYDAKCLLGDAGFEEESFVMIRKYREQYADYLRECASELREQMLNWRVKIQAAQWDIEELRKRLSVNDNPADRGF